MSMAAYLVAGINPSRGTVAPPLGIPGEHQSTRNIFGAIESRRRFIKAFFSARSDGP